MLNLSMQSTKSMYTRHRKCQQASLNKCHCTNIFIPVHYKNITTKIKYDYYYGMPNCISSIFNMNLHTDMEVACIRTKGGTWHFTKKKTYGRKASKICFSYSTRGMTTRQAVLVQKRMPLSNAYSHVSLATAVSS